MELQMLMLFTENVFLSVKKDIDLGLRPRPFRKRIAGLHNCSAIAIQNSLFVFILSNDFELFTLYRTSKRRQCTVCAYKKTSPRGKNYKEKKIITWYKKMSSSPLYREMF